MVIGVIFDISPDAAFAILAVAFVWIVLDGLNERRRARSLSDHMRRSAMRAQIRPHQGN